MNAADEVLSRAAEQGDPPAIAAVAVRGDKTVYEGYFGRDPSSTPVKAGSLFDLASLTKVLATTPAIALQIAQQKIELDSTVDLPKMRHPELTYRELLGHRSGLEAWRPFFAAIQQDNAARGIFNAKARPTADAWARARRLVGEALLESEVSEPGKRVYSDIGFMLLGMVIERLEGPLDRFVRSRFYEPLNLHEDLRYFPVGAELPERHILPTGRTRPREPAPGQEGLYRVLPQLPALNPGQVDDDNAFVLGGVAGHAGLFGSARAVAEFGMKLAEEIDGANRLGLSAVLPEFAKLDPAEGSARGLGFDFISLDRFRPSTAGTLLGRGKRGAIGHLGFTGCSLWIDLDRQLSVALLTNRTVNGRQHVGGIRALRPAFHDALLRDIPS